MTAINSVSGGGKTAVSVALQRSLPSSIRLAFDEFETSKSPEDLNDWIQRGGNLSEFDFPQLQQAIAEQFARDAFDHLILDYPFGRSHCGLGVAIDLSVFIDTPLDVAMSRGLLRDIVDNSKITDNELRPHLREWLVPYADKIRSLFLEHVKRYRDDSDFVIDGCQPVDALVSEIKGRIAAEQYNVAHR